MSYNSSNRVPRRTSRNGSSSSLSRPRSTGYYNSTSNPNNYLNNPYTSMMPPSNYSSYSNYSSPYSNSTSYSPYGSYSSYPSYTPKNYSTPLSSYAKPVSSYFNPISSILSTATGFLASLKPKYGRSNTGNIVEPKKSVVEKLTRKSRSHSRSSSIHNNGKARPRSNSAVPTVGVSKSLSMTSLNSEEGYVSDTEKGSTRSINRLGGDAQSPEENGELIDYKRLWEQEQLENKRLRDELRKRDELLETRKSLEKISVTSASNRSSLTEVEKREKRAMERKLSEMEEELKQLQKLKAENERLRAENRALTRVVSKLTTVPKANK